MASLQEKLKSLLAYTDRNGKRLQYKPEEGGRVYIEIDEKLRCIGSIILGEQNIIYHKSEKEEHIYRELNAWSINFTILNNVDYIWYETETFDYKIYKERALEFGSMKHFQDSTELKVYVPLEYWEKRRKRLKDENPEEHSFRNHVGDSWYPVLANVLNSDMMKGIRSFVANARKTKIVYPTSDRVFKAFRLCSFEHTKVILLGMSPYNDGSADGLAFSYLNGSKKKVDKSLDIIYKEIERDCYKGLHLDHDYNLEHWAKQGVLLLNCMLTVEKGKAESHKGIGWERFIKVAIFKLLEDSSPKVFMFWGNNAKLLYNEVMEVWHKKHEEEHKHLVLQAKHPASDLYSGAKNTFGDVEPAYPNTFSGCKHFSQANNFLKEHNRKIITW